MKKVLRHFAKITRKQIICQRKEPQALALQKGVISNYRLVLIIQALPSSYWYI